MREMLLTMCTPSQFPFPSDLVSPGSRAPTCVREPALTFEDRDYIYIYLFSRRKENRASFSIDFSCLL